MHSSIRVTVPEANTVGAGQQATGNRQLLLSPSQLSLDFEHEFQHTGHLIGQPAALS